MDVEYTYDDNDDKTDIFLSELTMGQSFERYLFKILII